MVWTIRKIPTRTLFATPGRARCALTGCLVVLVLAGSLSFAPTTALASRLGTDRIGGVRLSAVPVPAASAPDISARSGALVAGGGRVLWTRKALTRRAMASTTKLMTALIVVERCRLDETVRVSRAAARTRYATGLRTGERRSVRKLLELTLVGSSNDAAAALAIHVGGSTSGFARMMNARAKQLGLTNTHFRNPHGLDATGHYSSAADMAAVMRAAIQRPEIRRILALRSTRLPRHKNRRARTIRSTDKLLGQVSGLRGGKTGFTNHARYCFVSNASRGGVTLTSSVLGASSSWGRFKDSRRLLEWGFKHYRVRQVCSANTAVGAVATSANPQETIGVRCAQATSAGVLDVLGAPQVLASLPTSACVPVFAGQRLGIVRFLQGPEVIASVNAVASAPKASAEETVGSFPVEGDPGLVVIARTAESTAAVAVYDTTRPVERDIHLDAPVALPLAEGQRLGEIVYRQDGDELVRVPVVVARVTQAVSAR